MEIKDPIHGPIEISKAETPVLDSLAFQRLRLIKQLGFSEFSFPGATHNRYIHSLGVCHLSSFAFDSIFQDMKFSSQRKKENFRQCVRLAALLHDVGHGPLSHTTEEVMPPVKDLDLSIYKSKSVNARKATHEDYTLKIVSEGQVGAIIQKQFPELDPFYVCCLIDKSLVAKDDFFVDQGLDFRIILSQIVSSEIDVDRMDYLCRDSYFTGTNYGVVEYKWLLANFNYYVKENKQVHLAINKKALYTFDDFLLSRHHMHLMVYFHHKSIVYEEMLYRYLTSKDCDFVIPSDLQNFYRCSDSSLYEHMYNSDNFWAKRITLRKPFKMLAERHVNSEDGHFDKLKTILEEKNIDAIFASSTARLSKYHDTGFDKKAVEIYVLDDFEKKAKPSLISDSTEIFLKYQKTRSIERLYVSSENISKAKEIIELS